MNGDSVAVTPRPAWRVRRSRRPHQRDHLVEPPCAIRLHRQQRPDRVTAVEDPSGTGSTPPKLSPVSPTRSNRAQTDRPW